MLLLIDGDVYAHKCCMSRFKIPVDPSLGYDEVVQMVMDKQSVVFSDEENQKYLENCWGLFDKMIAELQERFFSKEYLMAVKSYWNYRTTMFPAYKMNRHKDPSKMNQFVPVIRQRAIERRGAIEAVNREADDLVSIWAYQAMRAGDDYVISSIDKDLDCIPGEHYNPATKESYTVTPVEAMNFFHQQLLMGDPTDNIPGVPKLGPVKAKALCSGVTDEEELQEIVVMQYMNAFDNDWEDMLLSNGKMLYMQRSEDDFFTLENWPMVKYLREEKHGKSPIITPNSAAANPAPAPCKPSDAEVERPRVPTFKTPPPKLIHTPKNL